MKKFILSSLLILNLVNLLSAETLLKSIIGEMTLSPSGNPYIIDEYIDIPEDSKLTIKSGCIFLFKSFAGMKVFGTIIVEGTKDQPVVFTSINDANFNKNTSQLPNTFDWNGIYIQANSIDAKFRNFTLMYSTFGIKSQKEDITIQSGNFQNNGQFHFTINDNIQYVQDDISYTYNASQNKSAPKKEATTSKSKKSKPVGTKKSRNSNTVTVLNPKEDNKSKRLKVIKFTCLGVGSASILGGIVAGVITRSNYTKAEDNNNDYDFYYDKVKNGRIALSSLLCVGISLDVAAAFLFIRKKESKSIKKVSFDFNPNTNSIGTILSGSF